MVFDKKYNLAVSKSDKSHILSMGYGLLSFVALLFAPVISWVLTIIPLVLTGEYLKTPQRMFLSVIFILSIALMVSSRGIGGGSDDFYNSYYGNFLAILQGDYFAIFAYGSGVELGLPFVHYLIGMSFGEIQPHILLFLYSVTILVMFYIWIEKYGMDFIDNNKKSLVVSASLFLFSAVLTTQLVRQMYSSVLVLYAITAIGNKRFIFLLFASLFHITAIPLFVLIKFIQKYQKTAFIFALIMLVFVFLFLDKVLIFLIQSAFLPDALTAKFNYVVNFLGNNYVDWGSVKRMLLILLIYLLIRDNNALQSKNWEGVVILFSIISLTMVNVTGFSLRATLLVVAVLFGYLVSIRLAESKYWRFLQVVSLLWVVKLSMHSLNLDGDMRVWALWVSFDSIGAYPLYYWF